MAIKCELCPCFSWKTMSCRLLWHSLFNSFSMQYHSNNYDGYNQIDDQVPCDGESAMKTIWRTIRAQFALFVVILEIMLWAALSWLRKILYERCDSKS